MFFLLVVWLFLLQSALEIVVVGKCVEIHDLQSLHVCLRRETFQCRGKRTVALLHVGDKP